MWPFNKRKIDYTREATVYKLDEDNFLICTYLRIRCKNKLIDNYRNDFCVNNSDLAIKVANSFMEEGVIYNTASENVVFEDKYEYSF